jgi:glycosyltransferase involved in cell wall biosynthesis
VAAVSYAIETWKKQADVSLLVATNDSDLASPHVYGGVPLLKLPSLGLFRSSRLPAAFFAEALLNPIIQCPRLVRTDWPHSKRSNPVIVIATSPYPSDVLAAVILCHRLDCNGVVYYFHLVPSPFWFPRRRGGFFRCTINWLLSLSSLTLTRIAGLALGLCVPSQANSLGTFATGDVLKLAVAPALPRGLEDRSGGPRNPMQVCYLGRISSAKGIADLLGAWRLVETEVPGCHLILAGKPSKDASYTRDLQEKVPGLRHSSIRWAGQISEDEKLKLLSESQLFVSASYEEGWSMAAMEAALLGALPVIYDLPAYEYLGPDAVRIPVGDVGGMARAISGLLGHPIEVRQRAERVKKWVAKYSPAEEYIVQLDAIRRLASKRRPGLNARNENTHGA